MRKIAFILTILSFNFTFYAQNNKLLNELNKIKGANEQVSYVLNFPVKNLEKISLTEKLDSDLNTMASCVISFVQSKELGLTEMETVDLKTRIEKIATKLFELNNYVLLKNSGGYAPIYGVEIDTIEEKKVVILNLGGDCTIDEADLKWEEITAVFNKRMELLLNK